MWIPNLRCTLSVVAVTFECSTSGVNSSLEKVKFGYSNQFLAELLCLVSVLRAERTTAYKVF